MSLFFWRFFRRQVLALALLWGWWGEKRQTRQVIRRIRGWALFGGSLLGFGRRLHDFHALGLFKFWKRWNFTDERQIAPARGFFKFWGCWNYTALGLFWRCFVYLTGHRFVILLTRGVLLCLFRLFPVDGTDLRLRVRLILDHLQPQVI
jgi:hypothetical protein